MYYKNNTFKYWKGFLFIEQIWLGVEISLALFPWYGYTTCNKIYVKYLPTWNLGFIWEKQIRTKQVEYIDSQIVMCWGINKTAKKDRECWVWLLLKMVWSEGLTNRKTSENRFSKVGGGEAGSCTLIWLKNILGRGNSSCKNSESDMVLEFWEKKQREHCGWSS